MEQKIAAAEDIPVGKMLGVETAGKPILIANVDGQYLAIGNRCTHMGCRLSQGILMGSRVQCPCHGSTFDVRTGVLLKGPARQPEPSYQLRIDGNQIMVVL